MSYRSSVKIYLTPFLRKIPVLFLAFSLFFFFIEIPEIPGKPLQEKKTSVSSADESRKRINLWPIFFYDSGRKKGETEIHALGPFYTYKENSKEKEEGFSPLFYKIQEKETGDRVVDYLYPLGKYRRREENKDTRLTPIFTSKKRKDEKFMLFPFYRGMTKKGESYGGVFPLYGTVKDRFGVKDGRFFLWPLYSSSTKDDAETTNLLWPVFSFAKGEDRSKFQFWPLYGHNEKKGYYNKKFVLWPFFFSEETALNTENPTTHKMFFPLYSHVESPQFSSTTYLWPFFTHTVNRAKGYDTKSFFPVFSKTVSTTEDSERKAFHIFPIYGYRENEGIKKKYFLVPLYWSQEYEGTGYREKTRRYFFINKDKTKEWTKQDKSAREVHIWPAFNYRREKDDTTQLYFPYLFPLRDTGYEKNFPFLILYRYTKDEAGSSWDLLWKLINGEKSDDASRFEIAYLLDYEKKNAGSHVDFQLLKGLFTYKKNLDEKKIYLFYLPWGLGW
jgi:hypothetical protein